MVLPSWVQSTKVNQTLALRQAVKPPELNPETEESLPSRRSPEGPDPPVLTEVTPTPPSEFPPDLESVEKKMDQGRYNSVVSLPVCFQPFASFNMKSTRDTNVPQRFTVLKMMCSPYVCVCSSHFFQLEFSDDIVRIIQTAINSDGGHPESRKANSMVKSFFIRVRTSNLFRMIWYHLSVIIEQLHTLKSY